MKAESDIVIINPDLKPYLDMFRRNSGYQSSKDLVQDALCAETRTTLNGKCLYYPAHSGLAHSLITAYSCHLMLTLSPDDIYCVSPFFHMWFDLLT